MSGPSAISEAEVGEDRGDLVDHLADRVDAAGLERRGAHRQRDVDGLLGEAAGELGFLQDGAAGGDRLGDARLQAVQRRAHDLTGLGRHGAQRLQQFGDDALLAERGDALGLERRLVVGGGDAAGDLLLEDFQFARRIAVHRFSSWREKRSLSLGGRRD